MLVVICFFWFLHNEQRGLRAENEQKLLLVIWIHAAAFIFKLQVAFSFHTPTAAALELGRFLCFVFLLCFPCAEDVICVFFSSTEWNDLRLGFRLNLRGGSRFKGPTLPEHTPPLLVVWWICFLSWTSLFGPCCSSCCCSACRPHCKSR